MSQRRVVIDLKPGGWLGWVLLALLALPLLVLSFFFLTFAAVAVAVMAVFAAARIYWLRHKLRSRGTTAAWDGAGNRGGNRRGGIIDVESVDVTETSRTEDETDKLPPRLP